jgi:hypothetical protein
MPLSRARLHFKSGRANQEEQLQSNELAVSAPPGIVIQHPSQPVRRPSISAFIWGGKVAPVPSLPYGRMTP